MPERAPSRTVDGRAIPQSAGHKPRSTAMQLAGRTAIVTGAAQGIGAAVATALAREGARLCIADISGDRVDTLAASLRGTGAEAIGVGCDVSRRDQVDAMVA